MAQITNSNAKILFDQGHECLREDDIEDACENFCDSKKRLLQSMKFLLRNLYKTRFRLSIGFEGTIRIKSSITDRTINYMVHRRDCAS